MRDRINALVAWIQREMIMGRLTAVQAESLTKQVEGIRQQWAGDIVEALTPDPEVG